MKRPRRSASGPPHHQARRTSIFRRVSTIVLATAATITMVAAMAGPASASPSAGTAASPASYAPGHAMRGRPHSGAAGIRAASTPVPVNVTGDMTWTDVYTPLGQGASGNDTQTVSFHIGLTGLDPVSGQVTGNTSTYSLTDNLNESGIEPGFNCPFQLTGSFSGSGPVDMNGDSGPAYGDVAFNGLTQAEVGVHISYSQAQTYTVSGSPPNCYPSTTTSNVGLQANPACYANTGPIYPGGPLQGTYPNATVNLGCSATAGNQDWTETTTITGTLTITPSCGGATAASRAQASLAAASSCGLDITSPPNSSTVAITDPTYVDGAAIGPNDRAPQLDQLKLKVAGTSAGCSGPVMVNGVSATSAGDDWTAEIPIKPLGLGPAKLTATATGCNDASSMVTLINLNITSPGESDQEPITAAPAMPDLNATVSVDGYSGDTSGVSFSWTLDLRGEYVTRSGWHTYPQTLITGSETGTQTPWNLPQGSPIVGGVGRLSVTASLPGVAGQVTSFPRWIDIPGTNPPPTSVNSEVAALDASDADTIEHIFCWESGGHGVNYPQFNPTANTGEPAFTDVPSNWPTNPPVLQPNFGAPPAGIGIAQLDPASFPDQQWDWTQNVSGGVKVYQDALGAAEALRSNEQTRLDNERNTALKLVNDTRAAQHPPLPPITVPREIVPAETADYSVLPVTADAITRYNTGNAWSTYYFDYHYLASANNLQVLTQGSGQWVTQDGKWQKYSQWQTSGGIHTARIWQKNPSWNPEYVDDDVEACTPPQ